MRVSELKGLLEYMDDDAQVYIMSQESWPFEQEIDGVITREEILLAENQSGEEEEPLWDEEAGETKEGHEKDLEERRQVWVQSPWKDRWEANDEELPQDDVFIVEGKQLRYGSKEAWNR